MGKNRLRHTNKGLDGDYARRLPHVAFDDTRRASQYLRCIASKVFHICNTVRLCEANSRLIAARCRQFERLLQPASLLNSSSKSLHIALFPISNICN
jgi:hypothetical protein